MAEAEHDDEADKYISQACDCYAIAVAGSKHILETCVSDASCNNQVVVEPKPQYGDDSDDDEGYTSFHIGQVRTSLPHYKVRNEKCDSYCDNKDDDRIHVRVIDKLIELDFGDDVGS